MLALIFIYDDHARPCPSLDVAGFEPTADTDAFSHKRRAISYFTAYGAGAPEVLPRFSVAGVFDVEADCQAWLDNQKEIEKMTAASTDPSWFDMREFETEKDVDIQDDIYIVSEVEVKDEDIIKTRTIIHVSNKRLEAKLAKKKQEDKWKFYYEEEGKPQWDIWNLEKRKPDVGLN